MLKHIQQQLTDINTAYFNGEISYSDYRKKREFLLDSLFDDITIPKAQINDTIRTQKFVAQTYTVTPSSNKTIILAIAFLIICVVIAITFLVVSNNNNSLSTDTATLSGHAVDPHKKLHLLVKNSIDKNIWNVNLLHEMDILWKLMSPAEQKRARQSLWYPKLIDTLKSLASEQKALLDIGNKDALIFERKINSLIILLQKKQGMS